ncbi:uncharacterized protein C4orf50 homolog [Urocitellus parryii]
MEPTAQGRTEKSFSYVIRAPSSDALDVTHVDVKIDTCWIFRDLEESGEAQGCLPEEVAGTPEVDTGMLRKQLESSEQKPVAAVDTHVMSESRLRSRIQALEVSQRKLLWEVDRLRACVVQERSTSLWAQEQLRALQEELVSQVRQEESVAWRQRQQLRRLRGQLRRRDEALGLQAVALEHCRRIQRCQLGLVRDQERVLRAQVQRLERDVRHLCRAAGLLLAQRGTEAPAPVSGKPRLQVPANPREAPEAAAELCALQQRAELSEREQEEAVRRLREQRATERVLRGQLEELRCCIYGLQLSEIGLQGQVEELAQQNQSLREELGAQAPAGGCSLAVFTVPSEPLRAKRSSGGIACSLHGGGATPLVQDTELPMGGVVAGDNQGKLLGVFPTRAVLLPGQPLEGPGTCICAGAGPGPERAGELSEGRTGSAREQECAAPPLQGEDSPEEPEPLSRRQKVGGCGQGLLGGLSPEEEAPGTSASWPAGGQLPAGRSKALERRVPGKQDSRPGCGSALRSPEGSPGVGGQEEEEEKGLRREASSLGNGPVPQELDCRHCQGKETLSSVAGCGLPQSPRLAVLGEDTGPPRALSKGQDRYSLQIDALEQDVEACFQQLNTLKLGSRGHQREMALVVGKNWSFAQRRQSRGEESGEATSLEQTVARDTSRAVTGTSPDQEEASLDPAELHGNALSTPWHTLERARATFRQLLSSLKNERSQVLCDRAAPPEDQEGCCHKACHLEAEGPRRAARVCGLQQANRALEGDLAQLRRELGQYAQAISDLEECNAQSYGKISELEEENDKLKRDLGQLRRAMSQSARESRGPREHVALEKRELKALISELGVSYKELVRGVGLGVEGMVPASQGENEHLLRRVRALEQEVALQTRGDRARSLGGRQQPQESTKVAVDKVCTMDRGVQVTPLSGRQVTSPCGPPLEEAVGVPGGQTGPASDLQDPRCGTGSTAPSLLQDTEAEASEEDPRLCVQRLRHQVQTLKCQLRDQGWAHRERQEELKGKLEELQRKQHEADVAVAPLKAKLASLVHKCLRRNHLITRLLRELGRHGPVDLLLSEMAQNMVHDVALSEYAAAFLTTGLPELPLPSGPTLDPGPGPAVVTVEPGGEPHPGPHAHSLLPASEVLSPARILALHQELRQSICGSSQVNKSPLQLGI